MQKIQLSNQESRRQFIVGLTTSPLVFALSPAAWAHHGWSSFDETKPLYIAGVASQVKWQNPHVELTLRVDSSLALPTNLKQLEIPKQSASVDGAALFSKASLPKKRGDWAIELAPLSRVEAWKIPAIKNGDSIAGLGYTFKDEAGNSTMRLEYVIVQGKVYGLRSSPI